MTTLADSTKSIGIILVGGLNCSVGQESPTNFRSSQSFTTQYKTLEQFLQRFIVDIHGKVLGHNDVDDGELDPYFDVQDYVSHQYSGRTMDDIETTCPPEFYECLTEEEFDEIVELFAENDIAMPERNG